MKGIGKLINPIRSYAWGSRTAIARLLGSPVPSPEPQAEIWMGAHPSAPSRVDLKAGPVSLDALIAGDPDGVLGEKVRARFGPRLPYLFKVLAAAEPLSIQAHPSREQAREGFQRENRLGIPLDAPHRNYRDDNHKPEIICALTPFWALCGFRSLPRICDGLAAYCPDTLGGEAARVRRLGEEAGIRTLFEALLTMDGDLRRRVLAEAASSARDNGPNKTGEGDWVLRLNAAYPGDIGVLAPLLLNLIRLEPGQALFLPAGHLHAYLEGTGIELMANSDNVLRGGLTPKHVDLPELLKVTQFHPLAVSVLGPKPVRDGESGYRCPAEEFFLSRIRVDGEKPDYTSAGDRSVEILLCTEGQGRIAWGDSGAALAFRCGETLLAPASAGRYRIDGEAVLFKASIPVN